MKLVEQYVYAVGQKLSYKNRDDVKKELESLILDEIEAQYGESPNEKQIEQVILGFGDPKEVAKRYTGNSEVIGSKFYDLYFMIMKIIGLAMVIAFTTIFVIKLFAENLSGSELFYEIIDIPLNAYSGFISGIGFLTLIFIFITKFARDKMADIDDNWSIEELKEITIEPKATSKVEAAISIFFSIILLVLINVYPEIISVAEESFLKGIPLGHRINIERFNVYVYFLSAMYVVDILYNLLSIREEIKTKALKLFNIGITLFTVIIFIFMLNDPSLYLNDIGFVGFKVIFAIILVVSSIELIADSIKLFRKS